MISITVITCTYNASAVIERTLRSVLRQTYLHVEHLIIDGQSKDDTAEKIERYIGESHAAETGHVVRFISAKMFFLFLYHHTIAYQIIMS